MKGLLILIVVVAIALVGAYQFGGFGGLDPAAQAAQVKGNIQPGMTWEQVCDIKTPKKFKYIDPEAMGGTGQALDFDRAAMADMIKNNQIPNGFQFTYTFAADDVWSVNFDGQGLVTSSEKEKTMSDLMTLPN